MRWLQDFMGQRKTVESFTIPDSLSAIKEAGALRFEPEQIQKHQKGITSG